MIIELESSLSTKQRDEILRHLEQDFHMTVTLIPENKQPLRYILGGGKDRIKELEVIPGISQVINATKPFPLTSREAQKHNTVVTIGEYTQIGGVGVAVIGGPCSVESRAQILETAEMVRESGGCMLRGGAFKPRTSPYSFQGLGTKGLEYLREAGDSVGLPVVSEIVGLEQIDVMKSLVDMYQIGARNMQNFELLKGVAGQKKPILLKRGMAATIEEWLMAAEYLLAYGASEVVLCERGIRTFERYTRNSLDISSIPVVKDFTHLPILVDPSHATGLRDKVIPVGLAAIIAGADGLIVEVHPDPEKALSDGAQTLYPQQFEKLMRDIEVLVPTVSRGLVRIPYGEERQSLATGRANHISFQGQFGSYSEQAARTFFQGKATLHPQESFYELLKSVDQNITQYGVMPVENSLMGTVHESYDHLIHFPFLHIVGELYLRVEHSLIALPGTKLAEIKRVYSQAPGFEQCRKFLSQHPEWELVPFYDTAGAVAHVAELQQKEAVAIANERVAAIHNLEVLMQGIETNPLNYTRFVIISREETSIHRSPNKASLVFTTSDEPGALFYCLKLFADENINMKKIESRPIHGKPWQYLFYLDVEISSFQKRFTKTLERLQEMTEECRVLGVYHSDNLP